MSPEFTTAEITELGHLLVAIQDLDRDERFQHVFMSGPIKVQTESEVNVELVCIDEGLWNLRVVDGTET